MKPYCGPLCGVLLALSIGLPAWSAPPNASRPAPDARKRALLVGVDQYAELTGLRYCGRDIQVLRERLLAAGFPESQVVLLHDRAGQTAERPLKANIEHYLQAFLATASGGDLVLLAFVGHGVNSGGASYLCPTDARLDAPAETMISLDWVLRRLAACPATQKLLLVDTARADPRPGGERSATRASDDMARFARSLSAAPAGIAVLTSCQPGQVSLEDDLLGHGLFLNFLLAGLAGDADRDGGNGDDHVSLFELFRFVNTMTKTYAARNHDLVQTPVLRAELSQDYDLGAIGVPATSVEVTWKTILDQPDVLAANSPAMSWVKQHMQRRLDQSVANRPQLRESMDLMWTRRFRRPEMIILAMPNLITAKTPAALLAMQRAFAFAMMQDYEAAEAAAGDAIRAEPDNPFARLLRAMSIQAQAPMFMALQLRIQSIREAHRESDAEAAEDWLGLERAPFSGGLHALEDPKLMRTLILAQGDPQKVREAFAATRRDVAARWMRSLDMALKDYQRLNLGAMVMIHAFNDPAGVEFKVDQKVVRRLGSTEFEYCTATRVEGDWVWVEGSRESSGKGAWVEGKYVNFDSFWKLNGIGGVPAF